VTIDPETEHKGVEYHHEGRNSSLSFRGPEDPGWSEHLNLKKGGCTNFDSSISHKLSIQPRKVQSSWLLYMCHKEEICLFN